jgi:hypothetical protein
MSVTIIRAKFTFGKELIDALGRTGVEVATNDDRRVGKSDIYTLHMLLYLLEERLDLVSFLLDLVSLSTEMNVRHVYEVSVIKTS